MTAKDKIEEEIAEAKGKLQNLEGQLTELNRKIAEQIQTDTVTDNAKKILNGVSAFDLQQSEPLQKQRQALELAIDLQKHEIRDIERKKRVRLKLVKPWGDYDVGSVVDFGEGKGLPLVANGTAIRTGEPLRRIETTNKKIRLRLLEKWGGYSEGSVIDFGESKGLPLIESGVAIEAEKGAKINKLTGQKGEVPMAV